MALIESGIVTFYVWVWHRETSHTRRALWFILIMTLGNIAMSVYVLVQLHQLPPGASLDNLLK